MSDFYQFETHSNSENSSKKNYVENKNEFVRMQTFDDHCLSLPQSSRENVRLYCIITICITSPLLDHRTVSLHVYMFSSGRTNKFVRCWFLCKNVIAAKRNRRLRRNIVMATHVMLFSLVKIHTEPKRSSICCHR